jgi:DNA (cytosine-5)-methyltransferase 1
MEARRAQSFPDEEVLVGNPREKWKVVGNSVSRAVSLALGLSLREAWLKNSPDDETKRVSVAKDAVLEVKPTKAKAVHRAVQSTRPQQVILGEDSDELRGEEATGLKFGRSLGTLPLRSPSPSNSDTSTLVSGPITQTNTKQKSLIRQLHSTTQETKILPPVKNLKRSHSMFQETRILPSERAYKTPRLTDSASISSGSKESTPGALSSGMNPAKEGRRSVGSLSLSQSSWSASSLSSNCEGRGISNLQVPQKWTYDEARDRNLGINNEDSEGNRGKLPTTSTSSLSPYSHPSSFGALPTQGQSKAPNPTPSNRQSFPNILSENEILIPRLLPIPKPKPLPAKKYVPVDNSIFNAYAQTSRVMRMTPDTHNSRRRRARKRL